MKKGIIFGTLLLISHPIAAAEVECLTVDEGRATLVSERQDNYFSLLQTREIQAKSGCKPPVSELAQQRVWLSHAYAEAVRECSSGEQRALKVYVEKLEEVLGEDYPGLFRLPWRFIKVTNTVEGGLPHTAGDAIVLSTAFMHYIWKTSDSIDSQLDVFNLLVHEQVHVLQRDHSAPYEQVYEKVFGFQRAEFVRGFESWLDTHQVINPDGVAYNWV